MRYKDLINASEFMKKQLVGIHMYNYLDVKLALYRITGKIWPK